jgi:uncharacterized membrane protein (UPF0127 family)
MKFFIPLTVLLAALILAGCRKGAIGNTTPPSTNWVPTEAQSKLPTMKIYVGAETLDAELALTPREEMTGMMFRTNIQDSDSMLFVLPFAQRADFWMMNCPESISAAYINTDGFIEEIHHLEKNDTNGVFAATDDIRFVLETSDGWFTRHNIAIGTLIRTEKGSLPETFLPGQP